MFQKLSVFLFVLFAFFGCVNFATAKPLHIFGAQKVNFTPALKECFEGHASVEFKYCIHRPANQPTNGNVAYLLHGRNLSEQTWNDETYYTALVQQYWQQKRISPPIVVTVSFGRVWFLSEKGKKERSGLLDVFTNEVIKEVEAKTGAPKNRIVFGESMGGVNSLELGLKAGHLFQKVAALCPPVYQISPFDSVSVIHDFAKRTGANPVIILGVLENARTFLSDESDWDRFSPLKIIEQAQPQKSPDFYLSCGLYDEYGNFEGDQMLAQKAQALGFHLQWHPLFGDHCVVDVSSLAEFLTQ